MESPYGFATYIEGSRRAQVGCVALRTSLISIMLSAQVLPVNARDAMSPASANAHILELQAHRSLTPRSARQFIAIVAVGTFAVAAFLTPGGFRPGLFLAVLVIMGGMCGVHAS